MAEEIARKLHEFNADGNLKGVKSLLDPLSYSQRQSVVSRRTNGCPLLFSAVCRGQVDIAEYIIQKCGADVEQRGKIDTSTLCTALHAAVVNNILCMVELLVKLGADVNSLDSAGRNVVTRALLLGDHNGMVEYLIRHRASLDSLNEVGKQCLMHFVASTDGCKWILSIGARLNATDRDGRHTLLHAIKAQCLASVKFLVDNGADFYLEDRTACNALTLAILEDQTEIISYLVESMDDGYTKADVIRSYELAGAKLACQNLNFRPVLYWITATNKRYSEDGTILSKQPITDPGVITDLVEEFETMEQLMAIAGDFRLIALQGLVVIVRILGLTHPETAHAFVKVSKIFVRESNYYMSLSLLDKILRFNLNKGDPFKCTVLTVLAEIIQVCKIRSQNENKFDTSMSNMVLNSLNILDSYLNDYVMSILSKDHIVKTQKSKTRYDVEKFILKLLRLIEETVSFDEHEDLLMKAVRHIVNQQLSGGPSESSILHHAVKLRMPVNGIALILRCGAEINATDCEGNTPLHLVVSQISCDSNAAIISLFLDSGSHVDMQNNAGECPHDRLKHLSLYGNPLERISLQCLAARVICKEQVPYIEKCSKLLHPFIDMHWREVFT